MVAQDIFLGSGASITKVPELDFFCKITTGSAGSNKTTFTLHSDITNNFALVNNLYVGCIVKRFNVSNVFQGMHRVTANTDTTISFSPAVATLAQDDYFVLESYGAPCPAQKAASGTTHTAAVTVLTFNSDVKTDYDDTAVVFETLASQGAGSTTEQAIFIDHDGNASYSVHSAPNVGEATISAAEDNTREEYAALFTIAANALSNVSATRNGAVVTVTNTHTGNGGGVNNTTTTITGLTGSATTDTGLSITSMTVGTTTSTATGKRLLADTWLGIVESLTFPTTEIEMKQTNLSLGNTRNFTYQYKGIETAGAADINLVANHGTWLYYFLGKCTDVDIGHIGADNNLSENAPSGSPPSNAFTGADNKLYIDYNSVTETGPIIHRSVGTVMTPPVNPATETVGDLDPLDSFSLSGNTGKLKNAIEYTFAEQDGDLLPSFALEQVLSKLPSTNTFRTNTANNNPNNRNDEDLNFVKIARGCRVNTLTITANENEEVKMTINANTRNVHTLEKTESYDARRGVTDETSFLNYASIPELREPFFFSDGVFKCFGESFLKINTLTLTMNNNLQDRRFLGVGSKTIQEAIPAQRTYEISFTGHVTDDLLYNELINNKENSVANGNNSTIELVFTKSTGESIKLNFQNYFLTANNFPIAEDKGPIVVDATVMPRTCSLCQVTTHWLLQG